MKPSALNSNKYPSSYDQPSDDLIKFPLLQSPDYYSHASKFTKRLLSVNLESDTILQLQKWWDAIIYAFFQSLSTNNIWPLYEKIKS